MALVNEQTGISIRGHIKVFDPDTNEVLVEKSNAIHYENMSIALAQSLANQNKGFINEIAFGNGGTSIDPTGVITYLTPNTVGASSSLYNETYAKVVNVNSAENTNPARNRMEIRHVPGTSYTDIVVTCLLDYGEPNNQQAFDNSTNVNDSFIFDEFGLRGFSDSENSRGSLLTHVIFHPIQKSLNRAIQIDYTVRIQSLAGGV